MGCPIKRADTFVQRDNKNRYIFDDFRMLNFTSRQLALTTINNVVLIGIQNSLGGGGNAMTQPFPNYSFITVRDGALRVPSVFTFLTGIELEPGQMLTIEADPGEFLIPSDLWVQTVADSAAIHVIYGIQL